MDVNSVYSLNVWCIADAPAGLMHSPSDRLDRKELQIELTRRVESRLVGY